MTFLETIASAGIAVGIVAAILGFSFLMLKMIDWAYDKIVAKRKREHPALYELFDAIEQKNSEYCVLHNSEVTPRMKQIDVILRDWNYCPVAEREEKEKELEELRQSIKTTKATLKIIADEIAALREQIHSYVEQHHLEWAKKMGW